MSTRSAPSRLGRALAAVGGILQLVPRAAAPLLVLAWAGVIWYVSSIEPPSLGNWSAGGAVISNLGHAPEFGVLTLTICLLLPRRDGWVVTDLRVLRVVWIAVVLYAIVDECHQGYTPHRDPSACDVLTDATAAACVLLVIRFTAGAHADARKLGRAIAYGLLACLTCAVIATFVPRAFPAYEWL